MGKLFTREQAREWLRDNNLKDAKSIEDAFMAEIKDVLQEALEEEMTDVLGYSKYDWKNKAGTNSRNGHTKKSVRSKFGQIDVKIPRDTDGQYEPVIIRKHERNVSTQLEDLIMSLFAQGLSDRDIASHMFRIYGLDVSPEMISRITDKILPIAKEWQERPLNEIYPILYLDGTVFNVKQDGQVTKKTAYVVFAITLEGKKEVLGIWIGEAESSKFWMSVLTSLKNRGVKDILIASVDGLNGFEEAIHAAYPKTEIQRCIVHQVRYSTRFVNYKDRKAFCQDMKKIYTAPTEEGGLAAIDKFEGKWGGKYAYAVKSWRSNWQVLSTFFRYPPEIRRLVYTTNPLENLNRRLKKVTKTKGSFPTDDSLFKILYLAVSDASEKWGMPLWDWTTILNQLRVYFGERVDAYL